MKKEFTCIICPNSCNITVELDDKQEIISITGQTCKRGEEYVTQELEHPVRTIASSVLVDNGEMPLVSVRLNAPIPKEKIFEAMEEIKKVRLQAPVEIGQVAISNILGTGADVIVTKNVIRK